MLKLRRSKIIPIVLPSPITVKTNFPYGIAVKTETGIYWIKKGSKYRLISDRAAESWNFNTVLASNFAISDIKLAGHLGFRDGSLIQNITDGKMYLVSESKLRHIVNPDIFTRYGLDRSKIVEVSEAEIKASPIGEDLE
jgi:hypothetical protein